MAAVLGLEVADTPNVNFASRSHRGVLNLGKVGILMVVSSGLILECPEKHITSNGFELVSLH